MKEIARIIGSLKGYIYPPESPGLALKALTDESIRIVSLTITEGGYNINDRTHQFNATHPDVQNDLNNPDAPKTVFGYLCEALDRRLNPC